MRTSFTRVGTAAAAGLLVLSLSACGSDSGGEKTREPAPASDAPAPIDPLPSDEPEEESPADDVPLDGDIAAGGEEIDAFAVTVGHCLSTVDLDTQAGEFHNAVVYNCDEPHDIEVFHSFDLTDAEYPGVDEVERIGDETCKGQAFSDFIGMDFPESSLEIFYYYPTEGSWAQLGDREILCMVVAPEARSGSFAGSNL